MSSEKQTREINFLLERFAEHAQIEPGRKDISEGLRNKVLSRVERSKTRSADKLLTREKRGNTRTLSSGVLCTPLYEAGQGKASKGEPLFTWVLKLEANTSFALPSEGHKELIVLSGKPSIDGKVHHQYDYAYAPAGALLLCSEGPATVYVHCFACSHALAQAYSVHQAQAQWDDFGPGIKRLLLRNHEGHATVLYRAQANAQVPLHRHQFAEQCYMVEGDLYLDDTLLLAGDYEYAPAESTHELTQTRSGALLLSHTDLELAFE
jgi:hypothetical protein